MRAGEDADEHGSACPAAGFDVVGGVSDNGDGAHAADLRPQRGGEDEVRERTTAACVTRRQVGIREIGPPEFWQSNFAATTFGAHGRTLCQSRGAECAGYRYPSLKLLPVSVRGGRGAGSVGARSYSQLG